MGRLAVDEPVGEDIADRAAGAKARVGEAGRDPEPRHTRDGTEQGTAVGRDPLGTVHQVRQLGLGKHRDPADGTFENVVEKLPVGRQELLREVPGHAVDRPGDRAPLEAADEKPADLLAHVDEVLRVAQAGGRASELLAGDRLGGQMLVDQRRDRQADADHGGDLAGPHAAGVDHAFRADRAVVGPDRGDGAPPGPRDAGDPDARADLDA